jgi:hypothetical protein
VCARSEKKAPRRIIGNVRTVSGETQRVPAPGADTLAEVFFSRAQVPDRPKFSADSAILSVASGALIGKWDELQMYSRVRRHKPVRQIGARAEPQSKKTTSK